MTSCSFWIMKDFRKNGPHPSVFASKLKKIGAYRSGEHWRVNGIEKTSEEAKVLKKLGLKLVQVGKGYQRF